LGVHDTEKYFAIKELLGIPQDEPIFILRAQDKFSVETVEAYGEITCNFCSESFDDGITSVATIFRKWQTDHPDKVKVPD
jgi:hypothetical protein